MIKFFRQIRQQLLMENRTGRPALPVGRYLKYAIGEILLVVIGILIALNINNRNEFKQERNEETSYLLRIKSDIQQDTSYIQKKMKEDRESQNSLTLFLKRIYEKQNSHSEYLSLMPLGNWDVRDLYLVDFTFIEITSSGKFEIIKSVELKESIIDYYRHRDFARTHLTQTTEFGFDILIKVFPSLVRHYNYELLKDLDVYKKEDWNWINDPSNDKFKYLESAISHFRYKSVISESYSKEALEKAINILQLIDTMVEE